MYDCLTFCRISNLYFEKNWPKRIGWRKDGEVISGANIAIKWCGEPNTFELLLAVPDEEFLVVCVDVLMLSSSTSEQIDANVSSKLSASNAIFCTIFPKTLQRIFSSLQLPNPCHHPSREKFNFATWWLTMKAIVIYPRIPSINYFPDKATQRILIFIWNISKLWCCVVYDVVDPICLYLL